MPELNWLDLGAATGARVLLLDNLDRADQAAQRLVRGQDGEALHDFRVALRRLRVTERAYRPSFGESAVPRKLRRRLRRLMRSTATARDTEVQLALLASPRAELRPHQRTGLRWLESHLQARLRRQNGRLRESIQRTFPRLRDKLEGHLHAYLTPGTESFAAALTATLRVELQAMLSGLSAIESDVADVPDIHPPRLNAKRARYLMAPVAQELPSAPALLAELESIQDLLGELHDVEMLGNELCVAAAALAAQHARHRIETALHDSGAPSRAAPELPGLTAVANWLHGEKYRQMEKLRARFESGLLARVRHIADEVLAALDAFPGVAAETPQRH